MLLHPGITARLRLFKRTMQAKDEIHIRAFSGGDYEDVIALWESCGLTIKPSDSRREIEKLCAMPSNRLLIAELSGKAGARRIIGAIIGAFDGRRAWIYHLAVAPATRRLGAASRLMREMEEHLRQVGALKINLLVEPGNVDARQFYTALGFSEVPFAFYTKEF